MQLEDHNFTVRRYTISAWGATSAHGGPKTLVPEAQVSLGFLENYAIFQLKSQNKDTINSYNLQYILDERSYDFKENDVWGN